MSLIAFIQIFMLSLPVLTALVCCAIVFLNWQNSTDTLKGQLHRRLL